eukprot:TRINITY_DN50345_c0_g1_i1.p1 TRINITY_DN50345_c0_g1~~TRINITY_DN50345_c0_g1_i1.p1  ORF type:complete len:504 (+),score=215.60 TRINITY_DN50345_c0_g1_i1:82-1512(+)
MAVGGGAATAGIFAGFQLVLLLLYAFLVIFPNADERNTTIPEQTFGGLYHYFLGVHVMLLVGAGFLITFLRKYSLSAVSFNYMLVAFMLQWTILVYHFWARAFDGVPNVSFFDKVEISARDLVIGDFGALTVLISFAAVLGKAGPVQLLVMGIFEIFFYELNNAIMMYEYGGVDMGGSMVIHLFGALFGLMASRAFMGADEVKDTSKGEVQRRASVAFAATPEGLRDNRASLISSTSTTDSFAMIGTLFLAAFWPSINAVMAVGYARERIVISTIFGISASVTMAFAFSALLRGGKFSMADVQAATLAGGVAVGGSSAMLTELWPTILIGMIAGVMSVIGFVILNPIFESLGFHDTAGAFWLHGLPGLIGGIASTITAASRTGDTVFGQAIGEIFPARANGARSASYQSGMQVATLFTTIGLAIVGGIIAGIVMRFIPNPGDDEFPLFDDARYWEELAEAKKDDDLEIDATKPDFE